MRGKTDELEGFVRSVCEVLLFSRGTAEAEDRAKEARFHAAVLHRAQYVADRNGREQTCLLEEASDAVRHAFVRREADELDRLPVRIDVGDPSRIGALVARDAIEERR